MGLWIASMFYFLFGAVCVLVTNGALRFLWGAIGLSTSISMIILLLNHVETSKISRLNTLLWGTSQSRIRTIALCKSKAALICFVALSFAAIVFYISLLEASLYLRYFVVLGFGGLAVIMIYI